jgi:TolB protein
MSTRRILVALIAILSIFVCVAGAGVAALGLTQLGGRPAGDRLIVLDAERRMRLLEADGAERVLAEDLSGDQFRYPAPAPDGERIAYISRDAGGVALNSLNLRTGERTELYRSGDSPPLYLTWSPDGRTISFLSNRSGGGLGVHTVAADGSGEAALISTSPRSSYFAWQPVEGGRLLLHSGGSSFEGGSVAVYERDSTEPASTLDDPGLFQAPAWTVDGSGFFYVSQPAVDGPMTPERVESRLTLVPTGGGQPRVLATEKQLALLFTRSPVSDDIAYITAGPAGFGALKVVDAAGGEPRVISRPDDSIPAFFWSPDGTQIAYLTFEARPEGLPELTWHVVAREGGPVRTLASFTPSQDFASVVNFFDAYASSLELWSPDSSRIVYGTDGGVFEVAAATGAATRRADGTLAMWARR